ncbi:MAG: histidine kinase [Dermatophilaceae bacterium]
MTGSAVMALKVAASFVQFFGEPAAVAITWLVTASFVVVGVLLLRTSVPAVNGWACILVAAATIPGDLNSRAWAGSNWSFFGFVGEPVYLAAASALVLRYPQARMSRLARGLVVALFAVVPVGRLGAALTSGLLRDGYYRGQSGFGAVTYPGWHDLFFVRVGRGMTAALLVVVAVLLLARLRRSRGLARQAQAPVAVIGVLCSLAAAVDQMVWVVATPTAMGLPAALVRNLTAAFIPVALLADLLRRRAAGAAVSERILTSATSGSVAELQQALRDVFVDGSVALELPDGRGGWLDSENHPARPALARSPRREVLVHLASGELVMRIMFDPRTVQDEALVTSAVDAVKVGAESTRMRAELLAALSEVGKSRARIVEASLAERRRVERDLHDGAQQQFLAVAATLAQADLIPDSDIRGVVSQARSGLSDALTELRALARGIHPAALSQGGLAAALPTLCARAPFPVDLDLDLTVADVPDTLQAAGYFVIAELLTNAARHSAASRASVNLSVSDGVLHVVVSDDGTGGARFTPGGGLSGLRDRVHALGGTLTLSPGSAVSMGSTGSAQPITGTTGRATLPVHTQEMHA